MNLDRSAVPRTWAKLLFALALPCAAPAAPPSPVSSRLVVESGSVSFDEVLPGEARDLDGALRVRVFSNGAWTLRLDAASSLTVSDRAELVPADRLSWRSGLCHAWTAFRAAGQATVARGGATGGAGALVVIDLRLLLSNGDPLGRYRAELRLALESLDAIPITR